MDKFAGLRSPQRDPEDNLFSFVDDWLLVGLSIIWSLAGVFLSFCSNDNFVSRPFGKEYRRIEPDWDEMVMWEEEDKKMLKRPTEAAGKEDEVEGYRSEGEVSDDESLSDEDSDFWDDDMDRDDWNSLK